MTVIVVLFAMREAQAIVVPTLMAFFLTLVAELCGKWRPGRRVDSVVEVRPRSNSAIRRTRLQSSA